MLNLVCIILSITIILTHNKNTAKVKKKIKMKVEFQGFKRNEKYLEDLDWPKFHRCRLVSSSPENTIGS